jgi:hypothetical protein
MAGTNKPPAIISLEEFNESINILVYGDSGVGKTVLGGTCPNALFLAIEAGTIAAKRQGSVAELWPIEDWDELQKAYDWLEENPETYDWVIIDTVTQMQRMAMRGILDRAVAENKSRDPDVPAIQDWPKFYNMFQRFILAFCALPVNVLFLAHPMHKDDEEGDRIVLPEIQGPSHSPIRESQFVCAQMDIVAYLKKSSQGKSDDAATSRSLLFETMPPYFAKDRYGVFPRWVKVTESSDGRTTKQLTTMADVQRVIETSEKAPKKAAPAKKAPAKATPVRRRPAR